VKDCTIDNSPIHRDLVYGIPRITLFTICNQVTDEVRGCRFFVGHWPGWCVELTDGAVPVWAEDEIV
jgi:hypothetical protein